MKEWINTHEENQIWILQLSVFDLVLFKERGNWSVNLVNFGRPEKEITTLKAVELEEAREEALGIGRAFLARCMEELKGEPEELRFVQVAVSGEALYGLTESGVLYVHMGGPRPWVRCSMKVSSS